MNTLRRLRNLWIPCVATIVLGCFSDAVAQTSYKVVDLGIAKDKANDKDNLSCAMDLNNFGWTLSQEGVLDPISNFVGAPVLSGRAVINVGELKIDLGTLGGANSWMNWGGINDLAQAVGDAETAVPDPNGEDICGFGTHNTCSPFLWQFGHMSALPTLGGNNGQASDINNRGQIVGFAENGAVDSSCPANRTNNRIQLPVVWEKGKVRALPTLAGDPDGAALAINDQGHAVGNTGTCGGAIQHAVSWENDTAVVLQDLGMGGTAQGINHQGQIVGIVSSADNSTIFAALWQNGALTNLGTLPGDFAAIATGINSRGQIVGSTLDSGFNWVHAFIYEEGKMMDLNTLFPASSNLFATMANKINERGQISGMATVRSGPHMGEVHAFLANPVNERIDRSVADDTTTHPRPNVSVNVGNQLLQRFRLGRFER
jgi:probable HAF family extracellular repeat protein